MNTNENKAIRCSVTQCANHSARGSYCSLDNIQVGTHEPAPSQCQCIDCLSFIKK